MQLQIMDSRGSLLEVPYVCYHCGGRSDDVRTLEEHIRTEHNGKQHSSKGDDSDEDDDDGVGHMLLEQMVEVQIKEEPEFLLPLDLSRKESSATENAVWIKQEPDVDPLDGPPSQLPKIRVASEAILKAPVPPSPLLLVQSVGQQTGPPPLYPFGNYVDKLLRARIVNNANEATRFRAIRPLPPLLALPRLPTPTYIQRIPTVDVRPRMPINFPQTPYFLEVPYTCYHCGGRSGDLETLKTHIQTMHNPESIFKQNLAAQARKRLLDSITENKIVKIKIPKPPKVPKERKVKVKDEKEKKEKPNEKEKDQPIKKLIIKIPKPIKNDKKSRKLEKMANSRFRCPFCPFGSNSFRGLMLHATIKHEQERAQKRLERLESKSLADRLASKAKKYLYCLFCDYKSLQKPQLKKHMHAIHGKEKHHQCPYCPHRSAYGENMRWHIMKHKYKCPHCEFRSTSQANLLLHEKSNCSVFFDVKINAAPAVDSSDVSDKSSKECSLEMKSVSEPTNSTSGNASSTEESLNHCETNACSNHNNNDSHCTNDLAGSIKSNCGEETIKTNSDSTSTEDDAGNDASDISNSFTNGGLDISIKNEPITLKVEPS